MEWTTLKLRCYFCGGAASTIGYGFALCPDKNHKVEINIALQSLIITQVDGITSIIRMKTED